MTDSSRALSAATFERFLFEVGIECKVVGELPNAEYSDAAVRLLWRLWQQGGESSDRMHEWAASAPAAKLLLLSEEAVAASRVGSHEVAVGYEPKLPFLACPDNWANRVFARIEWFQYQSHHSYEVMMLEGWQLTRDQSGTVLEQLINDHVIDADGRAARVFIKQLQGQTAPTKPWPPNAD